MLPLLSQRPPTRAQHLRFYTPKVYPPNPTKDVFEDTKHGNMHNARTRAAPPRKLTATPAKAPHQKITEADLRGHWINVTIFGILWVSLGCLIGHMQRGADDTRTTGPHWDPAGNTPFREYVREVHAWDNVTTGAMTPHNRPHAYSVASGDWPEPSP